MDFLLGLLKKMEEDTECSVKEAADFSYNKSLSAYHGWIARGAFTASISLFASLASLTSQRSSNMDVHDQSNLADSWRFVVASCWPSIGCHLLAGGDAILPLQGILLHQARIRVLSRGPLDTALQSGACPEGEPRVPGTLSGLPLPLTQSARTACQA